MACVCRADAARAAAVAAAGSIVRDYPEFPIGRRLWSERVFYRMDDGVTRPLAQVWNMEPWPVRWFLTGLRALKNHPVRSALRAALAEAPEAGL